MKNQIAKKRRRPLFAFRPLLFLSSFILCTLFTTAQTNKALDLNGANSYASLGTISPSGNFSSGFTLECWVKWNAFNMWSRLVELGNGPGSNNVLFCNENSTAKLRVEVYQNGTTQGISSAGALVTNQWYHVAVTQTSTGLTTLYVDGIAVASGTIQLPLNVGRSQCYIGRSTWTVDGYLGAKIDEVRIWNVARTQTQIRQNMMKAVASNASGLVAYYKCDEGSGAALVNTCTNAGVANGTVSGLAWISSPTQIAANAIGLDGVDDDVSIGAPLAGGNSYTKEAWVYVTKDVTQPQNIISTNASPLWISSGALKAGNTGSSPQVTDTGSFPTNKWVHTAVTYDAFTGAMKLYRNGTLVALTTVATNSYTGGSTFVGAWTNNGTSATEAYLGGAIDEVRIWNVVRTQSEIQASMNKELDPTAETNLVAYYTFDQGLTAGDNSGMITVPNQSGTTNGTLQNITLNGTSSNFLQQKSGIFILPLRFVSFGAVKNGTGVHLHWSATGEETGSRFSVEHSRDGRSWTSLNEMDANATGKMNNYLYVHANPPAGMNYYRIGCKSGDKTVYSNVAAVTLGATEKLFHVQNTVVTNGALKVQVSQPTVLSLYSQDGKMVWKKHVDQGLQSLSVDGIARGIYILSSSAGPDGERIIVN